MCSSHIFFHTILVRECHPCGMADDGCTILLFAIAGCRLPPALFALACPLCSHRSVPYLTTLRGWRRYNLGAILGEQCCPDFAQRTCPRSQLAHVLRFLFQVR